MEKKKEHKKLFLPSDRNSCKRLAGESLKGRVSSSDGRIKSTFMLLSHCTSYR